MGHSRRLLALVLLVALAGCDSPDGPTSTPAAALPGVVVCATALRHFSEWDQTAPRITTEVNGATTDELAEFAMAADEFFAQTKGYTGDAAALLTVLVDDYRAYLEMVRAGAGTANPALVQAAAESASGVRASFRTFAAESDCRPA